MAVIKAVSSKAGIGHAIDYVTKKEKTEEKLVSGLHCEPETVKEEIFVVTFLFYLILKCFNTANIIPSTISVTTSFLAVYLTFRRSPYFALAYAANDIVLIILWILASLYDIRYVSVVVCFIAFFANDIYGFVSWRKMKTRQQEITNVVSIM